MPYAPQIDRNGSPFLSTGIGRWEGDVTEFKQPDIVVLYPGDTSAVPTLLRGWITLLPRVSDLNPFKLYFHDIKEVNVVQGSAVLTKQKVKFECRKYKCRPNDYYGITITQRSYDKIGWEQRMYYDYDPADNVNPDCVMDCEARVKWIADQVNNDARRLATAVVVSRGTGETAVWGVEVELLKAGATADYASEGLTAADELVPASRKSYTADHFRKWYGSQFFGANVYADDKTFSVAEVVYLDRVKEDGGVHTSSNSSPYGGKIRFEERLLAIVFDQGDTDAAAALTEFLAIANYEKTPALYHAKVVTTASPAPVVYPFTITRTDAGDPTAYTAARTAYNNSNLLTFNRVAYDGTKSTYELKSKANTTPTASGSDTVVVGSYGEDNMPCVDCE